MSALGVEDGTAVVIYDRNGMTWSTRVWWLLRAYGFDDAAVLDGGWQAWTDEGRPTSTEPAPRARRARSRRARARELIADRAEVAGGPAVPAQRARARRVPRRDEPLRPRGPDPRQRERLREGPGRPGHRPAARARRAARAPRRGRRTRRRARRRLLRRGHLGDPRRVRADAARSAAMWRSTTARCPSGWPIPRCLWIAVKSEADKLRRKPRCKVATVIDPVHRASDALVRFTGLSACNAHQIRVPGRPYSFRLTDKTVGGACDDGHLLVAADGDGRERWRRTRIGAPGPAELPRNGLDLDLDRDRDARARRRHDQLHASGPQRRQRVRPATCHRLSVDAAAAGRRRRRRRHLAESTRDQTPRPDVAADVRVPADRPRLQRSSAQRRRRGRRRSVSVDGRADLHDIPTPTSAQHRQGRSASRSQPVDHDRQDRLDPRTARRRRTSPTRTRSRTRARPAGADGPASTRHATTSASNPTYAERRQRRRQALSNGETWTYTCTMHHHGRRLVHQHGERRAR